MQLVGLTGGIGSGKTTVARVFEILGVPVYHSDQKARQLMENDSKLRAAIDRKFSSDSYRSDGSLNVAYLAELAFSDPSCLRELNALVHPYVAADIKSWMQQQVGPYVLMETALIRETMAMTQIFRIVAVIADANIRTERVRHRDGLDPARVQQRMSRQLNDTELHNLADYTVINNGTKSLIAQCLAIHKSLLGDVERDSRKS